MRGVGLLPLAREAHIVIARIRARVLISSRVGPVVGRVDGLCDGVYHRKHVQGSSSCEVSVESYRGCLVFEVCRVDSRSTVVRRKIDISEVRRVEEVRDVGQSRIRKYLVDQSLCLDKGRHLALLDAVGTCPGWVVGEAPVETFVDDSVPHLRANTQPEPRACHVGVVELVIVRGKVEVRKHLLSHLLGYIELLGKEDALHIDTSVGSCHPLELDISKNYWDSSPRKSGRVPLLPEERAGVPVVSPLRDISGLINKP